MLAVPRAFALPIPLLPVPPAPSLIPVAYPSRPSGLCSKVTWLVSMCLSTSHNLQPPQYFLSLLTLQSLSHPLSRLRVLFAVFPPASEFLKEDPLLGPHAVSPTSRTVPGTEQLLNKPLQNECMSERIDDVMDALSSIIRLLAERSLVWGEKERKDKEQRGQVRTSWGLTLSPFLLWMLTDPSPGHSK